MTCAIVDFFWRRPYPTKINDSNPEADDRAERSIQMAEQGFHDSLDRVVESADVQQAHRFVRERNHLGPALLDPIIRRGKQL